MGRRRLRRLLVGADAYRWHVGHSHTRDGNRVLDCREVVLLRKEGSPGHIRVVFRAGEGGLVSDGSPYTHDGGVQAHGDDDNDGDGFNLHRPGVVRALVDVVTERGHDFGSSAEIDGWPLLPDVRARLADGPHASPAGGDRPS